MSEESDATTTQPQIKIFEDNEAEDNEIITMYILIYIYIYIYIIIHTIYNIIIYIIRKIITIIRLHPTWVAHKHDLSLNLSNLTIKSTTQQKQKPLIKSSGQKGCIRNKANQQPPWQNQSKVLLDKCQQLSPNPGKEKNIAQPVEVAQVAAAMALQDHHVKKKT